VDPDAADSNRGSSMQTGDHVHDLGPGTTEDETAGREDIAQSRGEGRGGREPLAKFTPMGSDDSDPEKPIKIGPPPPP
jgi:hypothetical protein